MAQNVSRGSSSDGLKTKFFCFCFLISYICFECSGWALFILIIGTLNKISPSEVIILQPLPLEGRQLSVYRGLVHEEYNSANPPTQKGD